MSAPWSDNSPPHSVPAPNAVFLNAVFLDEEQK